MLGFSAMVGVCIRENRLLRDSGLGVLEKRNNEQMHKTQMLMFPWSHLDRKLQS